KVNIFFGRCNTPSWRRLQEFSQLIDLQLLDSPADTLTLLCDPFTFQPTQSDNEAGTAYLCDLTLTVDTPPYKDLHPLQSLHPLQTLQSPRNAIITLRTTDGDTFHIGSTLIPARVSLVPHLNRSQLIIKCTSLQNPLI
ncbi:MAG: hypothetical protein ACI36Z_00380, partial [Alloprevotella sp.]